jgi:hypothetical protein
MQTEDTRDLVKAVYAAFASRDEAKIAALFEDDAEWIAPADNGTAEALGAPDGMTGAANIARFIATESMRLFKTRSVTFRGIYADGDTAITDFTMTAELVNGAPYENDYCFIFTCRDGRVSQMREYMNTLTGRRQIFAKGHPFG